MKKWILAILVAVCGACFALGLAACVPDGLGTHAWSEKWSHTISQHWHDCDDKGCNGTDMVGDHEWELIKTFTAPTCKFSGEGRYICTVCGVTLDDVIPATGEHDWKVYSVDVEATCTEEGVQTEICDECAMAKVVVVPATGKHEFGGELLADKDGHYQLCLNGCGKKSVSAPHVEGEPVETQPSAFNYNDGKREYYCTDCGYLIRTESIENPRAPKTLQVQIINSDLVTSADGKSGSVNLTVGTQRTVTLRAYTESGDSVATSMAYMDTNDGIRAYLEDELTGVRTPIGLQNSDKVNFTYNSGLFRIEVFQTGTFLVIINFETGEVGTQNHRVRVSYALEITATR